MFHVSPCTKGGGANGSTYTFTFHESGELHGTGMDTDGE
jgi:hypothetical protein